MSEKRFHNPYNFVPALPAKAQNGSPLAQGEPKGHDKYHDRHWSGRIGIEIKVQTPLILPDAARAIEKTEGPEKGHKTFGLRKYFDQEAKELRPLLPVTSFKGALRNGYEIITNSRFGVFEKHDAPPARRMGAREALDLVPVRFISTDKVECLTGENQGFPVPAAGEAQHAAWIPFGRANSLPNNWRTSFHHGDPVTVRLQKIKRNAHARSYYFWEVVSVVAGHNKDTKLNFNTRSKCTSPQYTPSSEAHDLITANGYVFRNNKNFNRKHDERIFLLPTGGARTLALVKEVTDRYKKLIENYKNTDGPMPVGCSRSRHMTIEPINALVVGTLCYAKLDKADNIIDLYPVMISRELGHVAPREMLDESLRPATRFDHLSPADRVFGWVAQERGDKNQSAAWRGQLRILPIKCASSAKEAIEQPNGTDGIALTTLSTPKIAQARFYLGEKDGEPLKGDPKTSGYFEKVANDKAPQKALRGRKVYPHHRKYLPGEYQQVDNARSDQNRSIIEWVRAGTKFTASIDVINLKPEELGALLWLLDMNHWQEAGNAQAHLRLGYGKPLGFGSVTVRITSLELRDGDAMRADYAVLDSTASQEGQRVDWTAGAQEQGNDMPNDVGDLVKSYQTQLQNDYAEYGENLAQLPFIAAWLRAARGFDDGHPIHYPRKQAERSADGDKNFEWFGWNESRHKLSLPSLIEKEEAKKSLPFAPAEQQRGNNRNQNNRGKNRRR